MAAISNKDVRDHSRKSYFDCFTQNPRENLDGPCLGISLLLGNLSPVSSGIRGARPVTYEEI